MTRYILIFLFLTSCSVKQTKQDERPDEAKDIPPSTIEISDPPKKKPPGTPIGKTFEKELPQGKNYFRVATWNIQSKTQEKLKEGHKLAKPDGNVPKGSKAMVPLALMKEFKINILCLQEIYLKMKPDGTEPDKADLKGTVYMEALKKHPSYPGIDVFTETDVFRKGPGTTNEQREMITFLTQDTGDLKVSCSSKGKVAMTAKNDREIGIASCSVAKKGSTSKKIKFLAYCAHFYKPGDPQLKKTIEGLDDHTLVPPLEYNPSTAKKGDVNGKAILMGDFNSYYKKDQKRAWNKLKKWKLSPIKFASSPGYTKIHRQNGVVYATNIYDDIVPTNEMHPHYKKGTKMPLPIHIFPMNSGSISKSPKPKQWDKYKDYTDHVPVKADYCIEEC